MRLFRRSRTPQLDKFTTDSDELMTWAKKYLTKRSPLTASQITYAGYAETCPRCNYIFPCGHIENRKLALETLGA